MTQTLWHHIFWIMYIHRLAIPKCMCVNKKVEYKCILFWMPYNLYTNLVYWYIYCANWIWRDAHTEWAQPMRMKRATHSNALLRIQQSTSDRTQNCVKNDTQNPTPTQTKPKRGASFIVWRREYAKPAIRKKHPHESLGSSATSNTGLEATATNALRRAECENVVSSSSPRRFPHSAFAAALCVFGRLFRGTHFTTHTLDKLSIFSALLCPKLTWLPSSSPVVVVNRDRVEPANSILFSDYIQ